GMRILRGGYVLQPDQIVTFHVDGRHPGCALVIDPVLAFSTLFGGTPSLFPFPGNGLNGASSIAIDGSGNVYITGWVASVNLPISRGAFQISNKALSSAYPDNMNAFVTKLDPTGTKLLYSTYLGGSGAQRW